MTFSSWFNPVWAERVSLEHESCARGWFLPLPSPWSSVCSRGAAHPAGVQSCGGSWFWQPSPGVPVCVPVSGLQQCPAGLCASSARWDVLERSEGLWGAPPASVGACNSLRGSRRAGGHGPSWPSTAEVEQRRVGYGLGGPVAARCRLVFPWWLCWAGRGPGSPGVPRRAAALAAGSGSCPRQVPPGLVIQEAGAVQEEPPAPGGRRGGRQETTPLIHALLGSACVTHPPAAQGELRRLPLGAAGGPGHCHPFPAQVLWGSGRGAGGDAVPRPSGTGSSWKGSPRFLPPGTLGGCPRFPGSRAHGSARASSCCLVCSLSSSFPRSLCPVAEHWGTAGGEWGRVLPSQHGSGPLPPLAWRSPPAAARAPGWGGPSCRPQLRPAGERGSEPGGHFPPPHARAGLGWPFPSARNRSRTRVLPVCGGAAGAAPALHQPKVGGPGGDAGPGVGARRECGVL